MKLRLPITLGVLLSAGLVFNNATVATIAQELSPVPPVPASEAPITATLQTVVADMGYFAGKRVRIPVVRVRDVVSPNAVLVETGNMPRSGMQTDSRVLIVLDKPVSNITPGTMLEIVARPWTYVEANSRIDAATLEEVKKDHKRVTRNPVLTAESVRTVGGLEVASLK